MVAEAVARACAALLLAIAAMTQVMGQGGPETPLNIYDCTSSAFGTIAATGGLSRIATLITQVEEEVPLLVQEGAAITFFAPSDQAVQSFDRALNKAGAKLTAAQSNKLKAGILRFHTLKTPLITANFTTGEKLRTALMGAPRLTIDQLAPQVVVGGYGTSNATIAQADVVVCRSVIQLIDNVLLPNSIQQLAKGILTPQPPPPPPAPVRTGVNGTRKVDVAAGEASQAPFPTPTTAPTSGAKPARGSSLAALSAAAVVATAFLLMAAA